VPGEPEQGLLPQQVPVDIVLRPDGAAFDPPELTIPAGTTILWSNHTTEPQTVQIGRRVITLTAQGLEGSEALTRARPDVVGQVSGALQSNPTAQITMMCVIAETP
jgi:plastocyanin